jgi:hypothetical protein
MYRGNGSGWLSVEIIQFIEEFHQHNMEQVTGRVFDLLVNERETENL